MDLWIVNLAIVLLFKYLIKLLPSFLHSLNPFFFKFFFFVWNLVISLFFFFLLIDCGVYCPLPNTLELDSKPIPSSGWRECNFFLLCFPSFFFNTHWFFKYVFLFFVFFVFFFCFFFVFFFTISFHLPITLISNFFVWLSTISTTEVTCFVYFELEKKLIMRRDGIKMI